MIKFVPREKRRLWRGNHLFYPCPGCWMSTLNHFPSSQWSTIFTLAGFLQRGFNDGVPRWMMVANPRYRPGPQKSRCETHLSNCKNSHIMLAPIHQQQVAMTIPSRGQPLSEYAQNCRRKISRQKLCRPQLLARQQHCLGFTKSLNTTYLLQLPHILRYSFYLPVVNMPNIWGLSKLLFSFISLLWPEFTLVQCSVSGESTCSGELGADWPGVVIVVWGEMREMWEMTALQTMRHWPGRVNWLPETIMLCSVTASSHETVCSFEIII